VLNALVQLVLRLRNRWPRLFWFIVSLGKRYLPGRLGVYPRLLAGELGAVAAVLKSSQWNMAYGRGLAHERLEKDFAEYVGVHHAIAVNTGGMALQMSMRALGLGPGDEVVHQVDTCSATAFAVMNAGCNPLFADLSDRTFMLSPSSVQELLGPNTKAIIATHMWGNPEDMDAILRLKQERGLFVIEDACLALGAAHRGKSVGSLGDVGVFSFGCIKPIQAGEGGMIVTNDEAMARELRSMRHWGDRAIEFGTRDTVQLSWNGRMSEILAAVVHEQLKGYPAHLRGLRDAVSDFEGFLATIDGLAPVHGVAASPADPSFSQVVLRLDHRRFGCGKGHLMDELTRRGIRAWHANFEPISSLTFFKENNWRRWITKGDHERLRSNYLGPFPVAQTVYDALGLGLSQTNFLSTGNLEHLKRQLASLATKGSA
jgi:dTDP-4-amino-4,6-dideoxygalactose transaminase